MPFFNFMIGKDGYQYFSKMTLSAFNIHLSNKRDKFINLTRKQNLLYTFSHELGKYQGSEPCESKNIPENGSDIQN